MKLILVTLTYTEFPVGPISGHHLDSWFSIEGCPPHKRKPSLPGHPLVLRWPSTCVLKPKHHFLKCNINTGTLGLNNQAINQANHILQSVEAVCLYIHQIFIIFINF